MLKYEYKVSRIPHQRKRRQKIKPQGFYTSYGYVGINENGTRILYATENEFMEEN